MKTNAMVEAKQLVAQMRDRRLAKGEGEDLVNAAYAAAIRWYANEVDDFVEEALQAIIDGEVTDEDSLREHVEEGVDGCQAVIYTRQAALVLLASDSDEAWRDSGLDEAPDTSGRAYFALVADVMAELEGFGLDWDEVDEDEDSAAE